jgi:transcriptional regulator with XRE-family HTH domain
MMPGMENDAGQRPEFDRTGFASLLKERGLSARDVALRAGLGHTTVQHILDGTSRNPRIDTVQRLAKVLGITVTELSPDHTPDILREPVITLRREADVARLPVYGVHPIGADGAFRLNSTHLTTVLAPRVVLGWPGAFAFYAPDEAMAPRWRAGELVLVQPDRPPAVGDHIIAALPAGPHGETWLFRRLTRRDRTSVALETYDAEHYPPWSGRPTQMLRVVDWPELL